MSGSTRRWSGAVTAAALAVTSAVTVVALTAPAAPADTGAACSAVYTIGWQTPSDSPPDFGVTVTVTDNASYPISGWTVGGETQPVDFAQYSAQVNAVADGQKFVTLNYGSDTPASAGAWARQAKGTAGQGVALWEVGNEEYGSWEVDNHADPHAAASYATSPGRT